MSSAAASRLAPGRTVDIAFIGVILTTRTFGTLGVPASLTAVLDGLGITEPTPIQAATLPDSLAGRDVLGRGRTGSGKTYAFLLPLVARLAEDGRRPRSRRPRALILAPTRELVAQIDAALTPFAAAAGLSSRTVFGGVGQNPQVQALQRGVDVLIACPGRLEDLIGQGHCDLSDVQVTVLDEADHMADLGFLPAVKRLLAATPRDGQRLLFSATLDAAIDGLAKRFLSRPVTHEADSAQSPVATMEHHVLRIAENGQLPVLVDLTSAPGRTVVFARTKSRAKRFAKQLNAAGVPAVELHGNLSQNARTRAMDAFHSGTVQTLVATDIAARGIHVDEVGLVIHVDPPVEHKAYLHRSGRTARAGSAGTVVTLMTDSQRGDVRTLLRKAGISATHSQADDATLQAIAPGERTLAAPSAVSPAAAPSSNGGGRSTGGGGGRSGGLRGGSGGGSGRQANGGGAGGGRGRRRGRSGGAQGSGSGQRSGAGSGSGQRRGGGSSSNGAAAFSSRSRVGSR